METWSNWQNTFDSLIAIYKKEIKIIILLQRFFFLLFLLFFFSCQTEKTNDILVTNTGKTQGTFYHIKYIIEDAENLENEIDSLLSNIDNSLSTYNTNSLISKINRGEVIITDSLFRTVFRAAEKVYANTHGAFDCSITPLVNAWGFGFSNKEKMDSLKVENLLEFVNFSKIRISNDSVFIPSRMMLDFNSIAQGFTVDLIAQMFDLRGLKNYLIEVGGEIRSKGKNADNNFWTVGIDRPSEFIDSKDRFQFILELEDMSLATSGNYRKFYRENGVKYSHVIDPSTGFPARNELMSVTVLHKDCMFADAYATAFMVMGLNKSKNYLIDNPEIQAYIVYRDIKGELRTFISEDLKERIIN